MHREKRTSFKKEMISKPNLKTDFISKSSKFKKTLKFQRAFCTKKTTDARKIRRPSSELTRKDKSLRMILKSQTSRLILKPGDRRCSIALRLTNNRRRQILSERRC